MEDIDNWEETASYIIHQDGAINIAIDGDTGKELSRNTDFATVFNAASAALATAGAGGLIFIKKGTYTISTGLTALSSINIRGESRKGTILFNDTAGYALTVSVPGYKDWGGGIYDLQFLGDDEAETGDDGGQVTVISAQHYSIHNCLFWFSNGTAVNLDECYLTDIRDCYFRINTGTCIDINDETNSCTGTIIEHCQFGNNNSDYCIEIKDSDSNWILENWFETSTKDCGGIRITDGSQYTHITRNRFHALGDAKHGIQIDGTDALVTDTRIECNTMSGFTTTGNCIDITGGETRRMHIINNTFRTINDNVFESNQDCADMIFRGNRFDEVTGRGINNSNFNGLIISDNFFYHVGGYCVYCSYARPCTITGNVSKECTGGGFRLSSLTRGCVVANNAVYDNTGIAYEIQDSSYYILSGNVALNGNADGFQLNDHTYCNIIGNISSDDQGTPTQTKGFEFTGTNSNNIIIGNRAEGNTANEFQGHTGQVGTILQYNIGEVTENGGTSAVIADGATIAHGLTGTPTQVSAVGSVAGEIVQVTAIGAANLTIAIKNNAGAAGTNQAIYWRAWL